MATTNKQPTIDIVFKNLASTAIQRGSRGKVALIIFDDSDKTFTNKTYRTSSDVEIDNKLYTAQNLIAIKDCFIGVPSSVTVVRLDVSGAIADALTIVKGLKVDYIGSTGVATTQDAIAQFVKEQEKLNKQYKAIVWKPATAPDCKHVISLANEKVTFTDDRKEQSGKEYIPTLLGIFAGLSLNRSATYYQLPNLKTVADETDIDASIGAGKLVLFNDDIDVVKISTAVNSLTTLDANNTELMTKVENIEIMDLMYADISKTFRDFYVGKYKNSLDRQMLFISSLNAYLTSLENEELLDPNYSNNVVIDTEAQRLAWKAIGKTEADTWDEQTVKNNSFKTKVFVKADIKMLESIENLSFTINLF